MEPHSMDKDSLPRELGVNIWRVQREAGCGIVGRREALRTFTGTD